MRSQGTLGPSPLDLAIAEQHERTVKLEAEEKKLLKTVLSAIKTATIEEREVSFTIRGDFPDSYLQAEVSVQSTSFEEWEIEEAADEIDMIMLRVGLGSDWEFFERFISLFRRYLQPDKTMVDQLGGNPYVIHCAVTRAHLLSLLDIPADQLPTKLLVAEEPKVFHYVDKTAMVESLVTGKAAQAVCGEWWIPIGDEQTHAGLPVCPDCQKEEPFAQAFRRFLRG